MMNVSVQVLTEANELIGKRRDEIQDEKDDAEQKREELKSQVKAQDDIANKRL